jgi:3-oxo-5-alpha-steroid 4-dehydrogenase 3
MDSVDKVRAFYIITTFTLLLINAFPFLRSRFIDYGARANDSNNEDGKSKGKEISRERRTLLDYLASWTVPHSWFTHYYIFSILASAFWAVQILTRGPAFRALAEGLSEKHQLQSMSINQVILCWSLLAIQGSRRLYESIAPAKPSKSRMPFLHWLLAFAYYAATSVAIWIEGSSALLSTDVKLEHIRITTPPSLRTMVFVPIFLIASGIQHDCHQYQASLKTYTIPSHPLFRLVICPHYTAECMIYVSLAFLAAPQGEMTNKTILSCLFFVVTNLGVTAGRTEKWYKEKFGEESVRGKWKMVPWIY